MCYFVKNVMKFLRELCLVLTEIWRILIAIVTMRGGRLLPSTCDCELIQQALYRLDEGTKENG